MLKIKEKQLEAIEYERKVVCSRLIVKEQKLFAKKLLTLEVGKKYFFTSNEIPVRVVVAFTNKLQGHISYKKLCICDYKSDGSQGYEFYCHAKKGEKICCCFDGFDVDFVKYKNEYGYIFERYVNEKENPRPWDFKRHEDLY